MRPLAPRPRGAGKAHVSVPTPLPSVSLVVVAPDGWESTFACLLPLAQGSAGAHRETIVVDDGSTDDTRLALPHLEGVRSLRNESPAGFVRCCNQAASVAAGDVLLFLDRDVRVEPGWLDPVLRPFTRPAVAAACPSEESGVAGAFLAVRTSAFRSAGGLPEGRSDAADALLQRLLDAGQEVHLVEGAPMRLEAAAP